MQIVFIACFLDLESLVCVLLYGSLVCILLQFLQLPLSFSYTILLEFIGRVSGSERYPSEPTLEILFLHIIYDLNSLGKQKSGNWISLDIWK